MGSGEHSSSGRTQADKIDCRKGDRRPKSEMRGSSLGSLGGRRLPGEYIFCCSPDALHRILCGLMVRTCACHSTSPRFPRILPDCASSGFNSPHGSSLFASFSDAFFFCLIWSWRHLARAVVCSIDDKARREGECDVLLYRCVECVAEVQALQIAQLSPPLGELALLPLPLLRSEL